MALVEVGRLRRAHGIRGELALERTSLTAGELTRVASFVWMGAGGARRELTLAGVRPGGPGGRLLVRFDAVADRDAAAALAGGALLADSDRLPDPGPGTAFAFQLIGLTVITEDGRELGVLAEILKTPAHPVYVVRGEREWLLPAVAHVVRAVDLVAGRMTVALPAGLEEV